MPTQSAFVVYSTGGKFEILPASALAILGEYIEEGSHHGRPTYQRRPTEMQKSLSEVVLFYWDSRDGDELSGWWFGDKIGGGQVWARNLSMGATPPQRGWRCPVDGPVQKHIVCTPSLRPKAEATTQLEENTASPPSKRPRTNEDSAQGDAETESQVWPKKNRIESASEAFVLSSSHGSESAEKTRLLCGEYVKAGFNHGRSTYLKQGDGAEPVWLYYWDNRNGKDFSGWWLGRRVGGAEVFGWCLQHTMLPADKGWRIPHDGAVSQDVSLIQLSHEEEAPMHPKQRLAIVKETVATATSAIENAIATGKSVLDREGEAFEESVGAVSELLQTRFGELEEARTSVVRHCRAARRQGCAGAIDAELSLQQEQLDSLHSEASKELRRAQQCLAKLERATAEQQGAKAFDAILPAIMESVAEAELAAEFATSAAAADRARCLLAAAKQEVGQQLQEARGYAPEARRLAVREFGALEQRCEAAARRLAEWSMDVEVGSDAQELSTGQIQGSAQIAARLAEAMDRETNEAADEEIAEHTGHKTAVASPAGVSEEEAAAQTISRFTKQVSIAELHLSEVLTQFSVILTEESEDRGIQLCSDLIEEHLRSAKDIQQELMRQLDEFHQRNVASANVVELRALVPRVRTVRARLAKELALARRRLAVGQRHEQKNMGSQEESLAALAKVEELIEQAEELVETVVQEGGDPEWRRTQIETAVRFPDEFGNDIEQAVDRIQETAEVAAEAIAAARACMDAQIQAARQLPADQQKAAFAETAPFRTRLINVQKRLNPYLAVRDAFNRQLRCKKELEDVALALTHLELDVGRAAAAVTRSDEVPESFVQSLKAKLIRVNQQLRSRRADFVKASDGSADPRLGQLSLLEERAMAVRSRFQEVEEFAPNCRSKAAGNGLLKDAEQAAAEAEIWTRNVDEAQAHWAGNSEVLVDDVAATAFQAAEAVVAGAVPALQTAKATIATRTAEAKLLPKGSARLEILERLSSLEGTVEKASLAVTQLKIDTFARKTKMQLREAVTAIVASEAEVEKLVQASRALDEDKLETLGAAAFSDVCKTVLTFEQACSSACNLASRELAIARRSSKAAESPSFLTQLSRLENRLAEAQTKLHCRLQSARDITRNASLLQAQRQELERLEQVVSDTELQVVPLGDESLSEEAEVATAIALWQTQSALACWRASAKALELHPHKAMQLAIRRLQARFEGLEARVTEAKASAPASPEGRATRQRALVEAFIRDGRAQLLEVEKLLDKADEAEGPFIKGLELTDPVEKAAALASCEAASDVAGFALDKAKAVLALASQQVCDFSDVVSGVEEMKALSAQAAEMSGKLKRLCDDNKARQGTA